MFKTLLLSAAVAFAAVAFTGCQSNTDKKLDQVLVKVDELDKKVTALGGRRPGGEPAARRRPDAAVTYFVPVTDDDASIGPKDAKVTIVEAFEFACPYCAMLAPPMEQLAAKNADVRMVSKQYVVHPDLATVPALGACAATKQGKWTSYAKVLWDRAWPTSQGRPQFKVDQIAAPALDKLAGDIGLDVARFKADRGGKECAAWLERQHGELGSIGVMGTPYIFINGRPYEGPRTVEAMQAAVDEAKKQASELIAKGQASSNEFYASIMKGAQRKL